MLSGPVEAADGGEGRRKSSRATPRADYAMAEGRFQRKPPTAGVAARAAAAQALYECTPNLQLQEAAQGLLSPQQLSAWRLTQGLSGQRKAAVADENGMVTREVNEGGVTFIYLCEPVPIGGESTREKDARGQRNHRRKCSAKNKAVRAQAQRVEAEEGGSSEGGCEQRGAGEGPACGTADASTEGCAAVPVLGLWIGARLR